MAYSTPTTISEALDLLASSPSTVIAGGTDLYPAAVGEPLRGNIIDISKVSDLRNIRVDGSSWRIGSMVTWTDVLSADLPPVFDALKLAAREVGSVQIQNVATVIGNICNASPAADGVPPLLSMDAKLELCSSRSTRVIPLRDFILGNRQTALGEDEMVTALVLPRVGENDQSHFIKLGARKYLVISIAMVAANLRVDEHGVVESVRIAVGACSEKAVRLAALEQHLLGMKVESVVDEVTRFTGSLSLSPIDDIRASKTYRERAAKVLVARTLDACIDKHVHRAGIR